MTHTKASYIKSEYGSLVGRKIKTVRPLTSTEAKDFGWDDGYGEVAFVIVLDDGTALVPSQDAEGNGPGHIFVESTVTVPA
jgi:hypothetical protein